MDNDIVRDFIDEHDYDVRKTGNGRWIDQKCTMDVVCFVADCVVQYLDDTQETIFHSPDIWRSEYAVHNVQAIFSKPDPNIEPSHDEYNKFYRQPLKMLSAAGVLSERTVGSTIEFTVSNREVLEYIALRESNALAFLIAYIEKTLKDSGLWGSFDRFFQKQTKQEYEKVKKRFSEFCIRYTKINTELESNRIFTKVLNTLAYSKQKKGSEKGHLSKSFIKRENIVYNVTNWRDDAVGKEKNVARREIKDQRTQYDEYRIQRAVKYLRKFNDTYNNSRSEVLDEMAVGSNAVHMHHIFSKHQFPELADYLENIIALTAGQHLQKAHPNGDTNVIDPDYQYLCIMSKTRNIRDNIMKVNPGVPTIYCFTNLTHVLSVGVGNSKFELIEENDFTSLINLVELSYSIQ